MYFNGIPSTNNPAIGYVIGQPSFTAQEQGSPECIATFTGWCATSGGLGSPVIHSDGTRLFVSDQYYNRILVWNNVPTAANIAPDLVLGQSDFSSIGPNAGGVSASSLMRPGHMTSTATHLYVVDELNNRILRFPLASLTANKVSADLVIGSDSFTRGVAPRSRYESIYVEGVSKLGNKFAEADPWANRVLLWNSYSDSDVASPNIVLGQSDLMRLGANAGGLSASSLWGPISVTLVGDGTDAGTKVIVSDTSNARVLIWNSWPTSNKQAADVVIGQADFTTNSQATTASGMKSPYQTWSDGTKIYASSSTYNATNVVGNRILIWSAFPTADGQAASGVLGQPNLTTCNAGSTTQSTFNLPKMISSGGGKLVVSDISNHRVLIWNTLPTDNTAADVVLGQTNFNTGSAGGGGTQIGFSSPSGVWTDGSTLIVGDRGYNAIRTYKTFPTSNGTSYEQVNLWGCGPATGWCYDLPIANRGSTTAIGANAAIMVGSKLVVADQDRNRVLIWNSFPTVSQAVPDVVLGQSNFTATDPNGGNLEQPTSASLWSPNSLATDGTRLFVVDNKNNRILVWNTLPTSNNAAADYVLGQSTFSKRDSSPSGALTGADLNGVNDVLVYGSELLAVDGKNNRLLIWNSIPTSSYIAADVVVGQSTFSSRTNHPSGAISATSLLRPSSVAVDSQGRLFLSDKGNHRVLMWNFIPTVNGVAADLVLGQADFTSGSGNRGGSMAANTLFDPMSVSAVGGKIYVLDNSNRRTIVWSESNITTTNGVAAETHSNGSDINTTLSNVPSMTNYKATGRISTYGAYRIIPEGFRLLLLTP